MVEQVYCILSQNPFFSDKRVVTHYSILAWEISWTEKPGGLQSMGSQKSQIQLSDGTTTLGQMHSLVQR